MSQELGKIDAKKSLGQHFLNNPRIPKLMADAGSITASDTVVEIGPGTGMLTRELLERGARVIGIEADMRAIESLNEHFSEEIRLGKLTILHIDIRTFALRDLGLREHEYKVVANIPYYLSGKLFRTFLETNMQPSNVVFLVQKEVAERIARDEKGSLLSLSVRAYGIPKYVETVKRGNFTPAPKVDSAIISVSDISHKNFLNIDERYFFEALHLGFGSKRKQLLGNLSKVYEREVLTHIFSTLGISLSVRGEDLPLETWLMLVEKLSMHSESPH